MKCYVMNFKGHGKMSSTKNTILVDEDSNEDKLLFCTDGLNKVIGDDVMEEILESNDCPQAICQSMINAANAMLGPDNITVIVAVIEALDPATKG